MDLGLKGKVAVVTGSSRGIGKGIALGLAAEGCNLVICARGVEALRATTKEIEAKGSKVLMLPLDVTQKETANQIVRQTKEVFGRLDILVNNVGRNRPMQFEATTDEDWDELLNLNLMCHIRMSRVVIPVMREHGGGVLLLISYFVPRITVSSFYIALITALILGLVNALIRPFLVLVTLPVTILTLGLFVLVINALLFWFVSSFVGGFEVAGFTAAFIGALIMTLAGWLTNILIKDKKK